MDKDTIKASHNIADYIAGFVEMKSSGSGEFVGLCPFHSEKTPSFTVSEKKQFYYCHGCGATGDVIKFVEQYQGVEFLDACKILGGKIEGMSADELSKNIARPRIVYPSFDKRDYDLTSKTIAKLTRADMNGLKLFEHKGDYFMPVIDLDNGQPVNLYKIRTDSFLLKGVSHRAASAIIGNEQIKSTYICVDYSTAMKLKSIKQDVNILIAFSAYNLKLIVDNIKGEYIPVLTPDDTHAHNLTDTYDCVFYEDGKFKGNGFE